MQFLYKIKFKEQMLSAYIVPGHRKYSYFSGSGEYFFNLYFSALYKIINLEIYCLQLVLHFGFTLGMIIYIL